MPPSRRLQLRPLKHVVGHAVTGIVADIKTIPPESNVSGRLADAEGRYIFVAFTLRQRGERILLRPISARYMHKKEIRHYEKQKAEVEKTSSSENR